MSNHDISDDLHQSLERIKAKIRIREIDKRLRYMNRTSSDEASNILQANAFRIGLEGSCATNPFTNLNHTLNQLLVAGFEKGREIYLSK